jgi:hypothetical protein
MGLKGFVSVAISKGNLSVQVTQSAKNGGFYQLGHVGRLSNKDGFRKMFIQKVSPSLGAKFSEIIADTVIEMIKDK